ncbi:MltA domain-containing protein, partial [Thauera phenylacetica B4P]
MPRKMLHRTRNALVPSLSALLLAACAALPGTPEPSGERACAPCPSCPPCPSAAPA